MTVIPSFVTQQRCPTVLWMFPLNQSEKRWITVPVVTQAILNIYRFRQLPSKLVCTFLDRECEGEREGG